MTAIKLSSIKTQDQFYDFADVWYQRVHKLREASQNKTKSKSYREKALSLYYKCCLIVINLTNLRIKLNIVEPSGVKKEGFEIVGNNNEPEIIMDKDRFKYHK